MKKEDPVAQYQAQLEQLAEQPSFSRRTLAFFLDMSLLSFTVLAPLSSFLDVFLPNTEFSTAYHALLENQTMSYALTVLMFFVLSLVLFYFALCEYFVGQTAGKRWMNLKVTTLEGKNITFFQALVRNLLFLPVFPFILFWLIDPLYLVFSKQRLSEQLSKTKTLLDNKKYIKTSTV